MPETMCERVLGWHIQDFLWLDGINTQTKETNRKNNEKGAMKQFADERYKEKEFTKIPNHLARGLGELSDFAFRVYVCLHTYGENYDPTQTSIAKGLKKSLPSVNRAFNELMEHGYLSKEQKQRKTYYTLYEDPRDNPNFNN